MNNYSVDKYLVKPYWETLRVNLGQYLKEAAEKTQIVKTDKRVWIEKIDGSKIQIDLSQLCCIIQHHTEPRVRNFYFANSNKAISIAMQWNWCYDFLQENEVDFFITKKRSHLIVKGFVLKFEKPFVWVKGVTAFKLDVVKENIRDFENWLISR
jgi:hypothetical protein